MVGMTNSELRLARKLAAVREGFSIILIDVPPTLGPLMNSALNAADFLVIPVDCGYWGMTGIQDMLREIGEIKLGTNPKLEVLGFLLTLADNTRMTADVGDELIASFGEKVFSTKIRRNVKLKEAPALGKTVFHHAPDSSGALDYWALAEEVESRLILFSSELAPEAFPMVEGGVQ
jgi:chromosome partitioning protein